MTQAQSAIAADLFPERLRLGEALPAFLRLVPNGFDAALVPTGDEGDAFEQVGAPFGPRVIHDAVENALLARRAGDCRGTF